MKKWLILLSLLQLLPATVFAHRLNEYLEATTISLSRNEVFIELRLTPGVDVAPTLLKNIDRNNDGRISPEEQQAYLAVLSHDFSLMLDGRNAALQLVSSSFPDEEAMKKGMADIIIRYEAKIEQAGASHQLKLTNVHYKPIAVYLVNCILPADTTIRVINQTRSADQSVYQLYFATGYVPQAASAGQQQSLENTDRRAVIETYFVHGVRHILTGYDHLLFLCALVLGAAGLWDLIKIVTAFTIAHSITLTLATYGLAHLPEQVVEPVIAASIVFVAVQNIFWPKQAGSYTRLAVAFFFGLFHGLGFAGGLLELMHALSPGLIVCAILGFSLGVEAGNQIVLLPLYGFLQLLRRTRSAGSKPQILAAFQRYASGAVAAAGLYYLFIDLGAAFL